MIRLVQPLDARLRLLESERIAIPGLAKGYGVPLDVLVAQIVERIPQACEYLADALEVLPVPPRAVRRNDAAGHVLNSDHAREDGLRPSPGAPPRARPTASISSTLN